VILILSCARTIPAHETDQFSLPKRREFADLGPAMTKWAYNMLDRAVERTNEQIRRRLEAGEKPEDFDHLYSQDHMVGAVNGQMGWALDVIDSYEREIHSGDTKAKFPGRITAFKQGIGGDVYAGAGLPIDPRQLIRLIFASTLRAYDVHLGTDKIGHFTDMGMNYYRAYRGARKGGKSEEECIRAAINSNLTNPILSEKALLGFATAGSYSNADMVSNLMGMMFYRNITEPLSLEGQVRPPMLVREGNYWKLSPHVRRDSDFFSYFISDHWDESLNPSVYDPTLRGGIRRNITKRAGKILQHHQDEQGCRRPRQWFADKEKQLTTYWGLHYGHMGKDEERIGIHEACFFPVDAESDVQERDDTGLTALHRAAGLGDVDLVRKLLERGAAVDARIISDENYNSEWGNTPLHEAAKAGHGPVVDALIAARADVNAANLRGITPLHYAARNESAAVVLLLANGARPGAADARGRTPLHWAAAQRAPASSALARLIEQGADVNAADHQGRTPLHCAAESGARQVIEELLRRGARAGAEDDTGLLPMHLAARRDDPGPLQALLAFSAAVGVEDDFGRTPLHDAASAGAPEVVRALLDAGADAKAADAYGVTPLHLAARNARYTVAAALIERGADPNAATLVGTAPLHEASRAEDKAGLRLLLAKGARPDAKNARGESPADVARGRDRHELVALLQNGHPSAGD
jgi:ankyrin repeat protein